MRTRCFLYAVAKSAPQDPPRRKDQSPRRENRPERKTDTKE